MYFRMNIDGTCLDYVQFRRRGPKFCGHISAFRTLPLDVEQIPDHENPSDQIAENAYVDLKGEIDTLIYVDGQKLKAGEKLELEIAYTSYRDCSKGRLGYEPCDSRICIWKGLFNDSIVNCPSNCVDESGCFKSPVEGAESEEEVLLFLDTAENVTVIFPSEEPGKAARNPRKLLWYLSAFGVLVALLLAAVCAGCCCSQESMRQPPVERATCPTAEIDLPPPPPPPPYHLFAPPPYDALINPSEKQSGPVFVIPIQGSSNEPPPPAANEQE